MARIVIYNPNTTPVANLVTQIIESADTGKYLDVPNSLINPELPTKPQRPLKYNGTDIVEISEVELDSINTANDAAMVILERAGAKELFDSGKDRTNRLIRALATVTFKQLNVIRNNAGMSALTANQFKTAIQNEIDSQS